MIDSMTYLKVSNGSECVIIGMGIDGMPNDLWRPGVDYVGCIGSI